MRRFPSAAVLSLGAVAGLSAAVAATAQTAAAPQYFVIHQEVAKPSMVKEYESTTKEFVALVTANKAKMPHFSFNAYMSPDLTYTFVAPVPNLAGLDAINADFGALAQAAGPAFLDLNKRSGAATEYIKEMIVQYAPELSYSPAQPRLQPGQARFYHYDMYYVMPGREADADALSSDYVKTFKSKGATTGYNVYKTAMGPEMPLYIAVIPAIDAADYESNRVKQEALLGPELQSLAARAMALTRRFETRQAVARPDLSVPR